RRRCRDARAAATARLVGEDEHIRLIGGPVGTPCPCRLRDAWKARRKRNNAPARAAIAGKTMVEIALWAQLRRQGCFCVLLSPFLQIATDPDEKRAHAFVAVQAEGTSAVSCATSAPAREQVAAARRRSQHHGLAVVGKGGGTGLRAADPGGSAGDRAVTVNRDGQETVKKNTRDVDRRPIGGWVRTVSVVEQSGAVAEADEGGFSPFDAGIRL